MNTNLKPFYNVIDKMEVIYRVHFWCPAGHRTYADYKTKSAAIHTWLIAFDGWYGHWIEIIKS